MSVTVFRIPQVEDVRIQYGSAAIGAPAGGEPALRIAYAAGTAGVHGRGLESIAFYAVPLDDAHDLSRQGPAAFVSAWAGVAPFGVTVWRVVVLAFTEYEATDAFVAVRAAIDAA